MHHLRTYLTVSCSRQATHTGFRHTGPSRRRKMGTAQDHSMWIMQGYPECTSALTLLCSRCNSLRCRLGLAAACSGSLGERLRGSLAGTLGVSRGKRLSYSLGIARGQRLSGGFGGRNGSGGGVTLAQGPGVVVTSREGCICRKSRERAEQGQFQGTPTNAKCACTLSQLS